MKDTAPYPESRALDATTLADARLLTDPELHSPESIIALAASNRRIDALIAKLPPRPAAGEVLPILAQVLRAHFGDKAPAKAAAVLSDLNGHLVALATPKALGWHARCGFELPTSLSLELQFRLALCGVLTDNQTERERAALGEATHRATHLNPATRSLRK